jgi:hypothetical protein
MTVDDTTVARWAGTPADGAALNSATFTPPGNSELVVCMSGDTSGGTSDVTWSISGGGLTWTLQAERSKKSDGLAAARDGAAVVWTAPVTSGSSMSISVSRGSQSHGGTNRISCKCYIVTNHDTTTPVGSVGENTSTTNNLTASLFTAQTLGVAFVAATEWQELGLPTSSDLTKDAADYPGQISVLSGYKAIASTGAATTANLDAAGTAAADWNWVAVEIRAAGAAAAAPAYVSDKPAAMNAMMAL